MPSEEIGKSGEKFIVVEETNDKHGLDYFQFVVTVLIDVFGVRVISISVEYIPKNKYVNSQFN